MKERFVKTFGPSFYLHETRPWWSRRWTVEKMGGILPILYIRKNGKFEKLVNENVDQSCA